MRSQDLNEGSDVLLEMSLKLGLALVLLPGPVALPLHD